MAHQTELAAQAGQVEAGRVVTLATFLRQELPIQVLAVAVATKTVRQAVPVLLS